MLFLHLYPPHITAFCSICYIYVTDINIYIANVCKNVHKYRCHSVRIMKLYQVYCTNSAGDFSGG